ncbi:MAG: cytochrome P460 family protein [Myxococcales bacterium]|nr:cytochrome P460 family protein [Myxococcales bacterium]
MRIHHAALITATLAAIVASIDVFAAPAARVAYPEDYRSWTHVKSMWLGAEHGLADPFAGLHHVYVSPEGEASLRAGKALPDGTVLVFDLRQADIADHAITEGPRRLLGVMQKDSRRWPTTGGWGFEAFAGESKTERLVTDGGAGCFACHESRAAQGHVFTEWRP